MKKAVSILLALSVLFAFTALTAAAAVKGDVSGDGKVTAEDARLCLRQAVGLETYAPGSEAYNACDVTGDGAVTAEDARLILRAAVGLTSLELPETDPENNEYNILRSGNFSLTGSMLDEGTVIPLEMTVTSDSVFMKTETDGIPMGMLQSGGRSFLLLPEKKIYVELSSIVLAFLGLTDDDLLDLSELGFTDLPPLNEAETVEEGEFNGSVCRVYTFHVDEEQVRVYMYGDRLLGFEAITDGVRYVFYVDAISTDVPAEKTALPADYKKVLLARFVSELSNYYM